MTLFAEDTILRIDVDYDKVRRTANEEYLIPKYSTVKLEPTALNVNLENLFNGNKFLGK